MKGICEDLPERGLTQKRGHLGPKRRKAAGAAVVCAQEFVLKVLSGHNKFGNQGQKGTEATMRSRGDSPACYAYKASAYDAAGRAPLLRGAAGRMTPELRPLADVLVGICVREFTARRAGKKKSPRTSDTGERASKRCTR